LSDDKYTAAERNAVEKVYSGPILRSGSEKHKFPIPLLMIWCHPPTFSVIPWLLD